MQRDELVKKFIRVEQGLERIEIHVCMIDWPGPDKPRSNWVLYKALSNASSNYEIESTIDSLLKNQRFFKRCSECNEVQPLGWMQDSKLCQSCAVNKYPIAY